MHARLAFVGVEFLPVFSFWPIIFAPNMVASQIKGSKDLDDGTASKKMAHWIWAQDQVNSATRLKTCPQYGVTQRNPQTQNKKLFSVKSKRLTESA